MSLVRVVGGKGLCHVGEKVSAQTSTDPVQARD